MKAINVLYLYLVLVTEGGASRGLSISATRLSALDEILSGPAKGKEVILHIESDLPSDALKMTLEMETAKYTARIFLDLAQNRTSLPQKTKDELQLIGHSSSVLHIYIFLNHNPGLLKILWSDWTPRNLLLYSLDPANSTVVLENESLDNVEKLALITGLENQNGGEHPSLAVYTQLPFGSRVPMFLGKWDPHYFTSWDVLFVDRYPSFEGYVFDIASWVGEMPFIYRSGAGQHVGGISVEMLNALAPVLNFTFTLLEHPPDFKLGERINGSWDGLYGMLFRREKHFTINNFYLSLERTMYFDTSTPCWQDGYGVFLLNPASLPKWMNVYRTFRPLVWIAVVSFLVGATLVLYLHERLFGPSFLLGGVVETWLFLLRALLGQGSPQLPHSPGHRLFSATWSLCCLVLIAAYTSNLVALLTGPTYPQRIHTLQQLAQSDFRVTTLDYGGFLQVTLRESKEALMQRINEKMDFVPQKKQMVKLMMGGTHGMVSGASYGQSLLVFTFKVDDWYSVKEWLFPSYASWFFPQHTAWKYKFDRGIERLKEAGLIDHWHEKEIRKMEEGGHKDASVAAHLAVPLSLQHLQGVFYMDGLGCAAGWLLLVMEIIAYRNS